MLKACLCGELIEANDRTHRCEHTRTPWASHQGRTASRRGYGSSWQKRRARHLHNHPNCTNHPTTPAVTVDHIIPKAEGGSDHHLNLQSLCQACTNQKNKDDARRGQMRAHKRRTLNQHE